MLASNGKKVKVKNNYHMSLEEFRILLQYVQKHCSMQYFVLVLTQALMGMRMSEAVAVNLLDFSNNFTKLTYRCAKTNQVLYNQPVCTELAQLIKNYVNLEGYRMKQGWLFSYYSKPSNTYMSAKSYEVWFWKIRNEIAKEHPSFNDNYPFVTESGRHTTRFRINTHSLRRLHRTILMAKVHDIRLVQKLCHYGKLEVLERYINEQDIEERRNGLINSIFNPIIKDMWTGNSKQSRLGYFG